MSRETEIFIQKHAADVIRSVQGTGIFPSIKMAQMIIESSGKDENGKFGIGKGLAVRKANNYFGIKADKGWKGEKVALNTPKDGKPVNYFRVYPAAKDSLQDQNRFAQKFTGAYKDQFKFSDGKDGKPVTKGEAADGKPKENLSVDEIKGKLGENKDKPQGQKQDSEESKQKPEDQKQPEQKFRINNLVRVLLNATQQCLSYHIRHITGQVIANLILQNRLDIRKYTWIEFQSIEILIHHEIALALL